MTGVLLILASLGWLLSVLGAVLNYRSATRLTDHANEGLFTLHQDERMGRISVLLIVGGATAGAVGTILAVLVTG